MRLVSVCLAGLLGAALLSPARAAGGEGPSVAGATEPQYLTFQVFTAGPGMTTEPGGHVLSRLPEPGFLDAEARKLLGFVGERGDGRHRLGIMAGPLALDYTDAQMRQLIERTFVLASKYKIAVGLHIDDAKFWMNRRDLWSNPANVEWLDWKGTPNTGQYLNWGEPWKLAPQVCFNSAQMLKEARRVAGEVIGPAIAKELAKLRANGEASLFAGVIVGWETAIGRDFDTRRDLGYCALTNLGFSEKAPPADPGRVLDGVVQRWIETWSQSLAAAGVPSDRIYSHIAFKSRKRFEAAHGSDDASYARSVMYSPPSVAFGKSHRPGFSTYPDPDTLNETYAALAAHGSPPWASAEGANVDMETGPPHIPDETMENYLARMFNHGATLINVFGWDIPGPPNPFRQAAESAEAVAAYRKFLRGETLQETPLAQLAREDPSSLAARVRALPARIASYQRAGGDLSAIQPRVKRLEEAVRDGRNAAIEEALDQIDVMLEEGVSGPSSASGGVDVAALQQQMRALPRKLADFQERGGDMERVRSRVESIQTLIASGQLKQAAEELRALEPILRSP